MSLAEHVTVRTGGMAVIEAVLGLRKWVLPVLAGLVLLAGPHPLSAGGAAAGGDGIRRALLVGVNDYASPAIVDLRGTHNDVQLMRSLLTRRFGFLDEHIRVLTDEDATRAAVLEALKDLVEASGPEDVVYFHFSGHGSQVEDLDGDETDDGFDETLIPHDGRTAGIPDITDDELRGLLAGLESRATLVVLDSCHSGTATRDLAMRTRSLPPDDRLGLYASTALRTRAMVPLADAGYVLMTGAAAHQSALDGPLDGLFYGFFSYALAKSFGGLSRDATAVEVHAGALAALADVQDRFGGIAMPEPQLEAPAARLETPLFPPGPRDVPDDAGAPPGVTFRVSSDGGDVLRLHRARRLDAAPGSYWALYPAGAADLPDGSALGVVHVTAYAGEDALADIVELESEIPGEVQGVPVVAPIPGDAVSVRLTGGTSEERAELGAAILRRLPAADLVGEDLFARFIVEIRADGCRVLGLGGLQEIASLPPAGDERAVTALVDILRRSSNAAALLALDNPNARLDLDVAVVGAASGEEDSGPPAIRYHRPGEVLSAANSLMLRIRANADCYLTVVDVQPDGAVNLLFPNANQNADFLPDGRIPGGREIRLPDSFAAGNRAGFHWPCGPPAGLETIRVFACTDIADARITRRLVAETRDRDGGASVPATLGRELARRSLTRGFAVVGSGRPEPEVPAADWTAATCRALIVE